MELLDTDWEFTPKVSPDGTLVFGNGSTEWPGNASVWDQVHGDRDLRDLLVSEYGLAEQLQGWQLHFVYQSSLNNRVLVGHGIDPSGDNATWVAILDPLLQAGDADQDFDFDQLDLVQVQVAGKYLTGEPATWGEGDWNGTPVVFSTDPPEGDGLFNQLDIVAAQRAGLYLKGSYASMQSDGFVVVPEPSGIALLALGLLSFFACSLYATERHPSLTNRSTLT
jgi:hypothetical protein